MRQKFVKVKRTEKNTLKAATLLLTLTIGVMSAIGCTNPENANKKQNQEVTEQQAAAPVKEQNTEATQPIGNSEKTAFNKMKKSNDGMSYEYSGDKYKVSVTTEFSAQSQQQYKAEIDINGKKADMSKQYEQCPQMTQIELAFADMNGDGKEDVVMRMRGYNCWAFAAFVDADGGYVKLEEPEDNYGITVNVLSGGKMEVSCPEINYKEVMDITEDLKKVLASGADGIYDDKNNLVKELKISAQGHTDTYGYTIEEKDGKMVLAIEKLILYGSTSTGAAYTKYYVIENNWFKLADTKIYYSSKHMR